VTPIGGPTRLYLPGSRAVLGIYPTIRNGSNQQPPRTDILCFAYARASIAEFFRAQHFKEAICLNWLCEVVIKPRCQRLGLVPILAPTRDSDERHGSTQVSVFLLDVRKPRGRLDSASVFATHICREIPQSARRDLKIGMRTSGHQLDTKGP
jgi:hypothetical protein